MRALIEIQECTIGDVPAGSVVELTDRHFSGTFMVGQPQTEGSSYIYLTNMRTGHCACGHKNTVVQEYYSAKVVLLKTPIVPEKSE